MVHQFLDIIHIEANISAVIIIVISALSAVNTSIISTVNLLVLLSYFASAMTICSW
ncbi:unnamed protein product [Brugia timori]|uniref:7TM_GPCR_Srx domain-containing protein n=1 Tax=Brugia timori TaxID=42155 RepID=A0A0R3QQU4_9BILA|nr:unnamed protein product [Brugia timori]